MVNFAALGGLAVKLKFVVRDVLVAMEDAVSEAWRQRWLSAVQSCSPRGARGMGEKPTPRGFVSMGTT